MVLRKYGSSFIYIVIRPIANYAEGQALAGWNKLNLSERRKCDGDIRVLETAFIRMTLIEDV